MNHIPPSVYSFLSKLKKNNNRDWFNDNKKLYQDAHAEVAALGDALIEQMNERDNIETPSGAKALYRIYRDIRFSKDKTPYKTGFGMHLKRATAQLRGGYYVHLEPGNNFVGGGFWAPNKDDMKLIRDHIVQDSSGFRNAIEDPTFKKYFGKLSGEQLKTAPQGFPKDHPEIELLRHKQFLLGRSFTDKEVQTPTFLKEAVATLSAMRPFFDVMSEMLTTDLNGVPLYADA